MSITTYGELKTAIANRLHRTDLTSYLPEFVQFAETVIAGDPDPADPDTLPGIRMREQQKRVTASLSTQYLDVPTDMMEIRDMQLNTSPITTLNYMSPKAMTKKYPGSLSGTPEAYTIHGDEFQFAPVPSTAVTLEISYLAKLTAFSADADYNALLTKHPQAYVYAACIAASMYINADPSYYIQAYTTLAKSINAAEKRGNTGGTLVSVINGATP